MTDAAKDGVDAQCREIVNAAYRKGRLPSLSAAVFHRGEVGWRAELGDVGRQYRIGSITKTATAVAVMNLVQHGSVRLDDPIGSHLDDAPYAEATLAQLLSHSAGITAEPAGEWWERTPGQDWATLTAVNVDAAALFPPGQRHHYSNLAYGLLGRLVARYHALSWFDALQKTVLAPLRLDQTTYLPGPGHAIGTSRDPRDGRLFKEPSTDTGAMAPAGQLWSTVDDLARWGDFLVCGDDAVLGAETLALMRIARSADPTTQHQGAYGLGLRLRWRATSTLVGHTGSMPGFLAGLFVDPESRVGAVILTNATTGVDPEPLVSELVEVSEPAVLAGPSEPLTHVPHRGIDCEELAGDWFWGNTPTRLTPTEDGFVLTEDVARRFVREGPDSFRGQNGYFAGEELHVVRRSDGSVSHLEVVTFIFTRVPYDPAAPIPGGLPEPV